VICCLAAVGFMAPPTAFGRRGSMPVMQVEAPEAPTSTFQHEFGPARKKRAVAKSERIVPGRPLPPIEVEILQAASAAGSSAAEDEGVVESWYDKGVRLSGSPAPSTGVAEAADADGGPLVTPIDELLAEGTTVLVGMPGAFTPTCNDIHLPGYVNGLEQLTELGVARVAVITTNDIFVNKAWRDSLEACMQKEVGLTMISDADGWVLRAVGLVDDLGFGLGTRSQRFALVLKDGIVQHVAVEEDADVAETTSAAAIIDYLTPEPEPEPPAASNASLDASSSDGSADAKKVVGAALLLAAVVGGYYFTVGSGLTPDEAMGAVQAAGNVAAGA